MDLSIIVVSWNTCELLRKCLASIHATVTNVDYEIVVVDNGSNDGSKQMLSTEFPWVTLLANLDNRGFAAANNQAIRVSRGRHLLLLNSDAELVGPTAKNLVELLDNQPDVGIVGGKLLNPDGSFQSSYADFPTLQDCLLQVTGLGRWLLPPTFPSYPEEQSRQEQAVDWVGGALLAVRRAAAEVVGLLDEGYFMYGEEMDWCYRMRQGGWKVLYLPNATAIHRPGSSGKRVPERKRAQIYRSQWRYLRLHQGYLRASAFRVIARTTLAARLMVWLAFSIAARENNRQFARQQATSYRLALQAL